MKKIAEELLKYTNLKDKMQVVTKAKRVAEEGTSGQWIQTDLMPEWIDKAWFTRETQ